LAESGIQVIKQPLWAICVTGGWLMIGVIYLIFHFDAIWNDPNELGDFLAGFFSPLAFLWLVIGYFQQQKELNLNTKALNLQKEELKQTRLQVERQSDILEAEAKINSRASLPILIFKELKVKRATNANFTQINFLNSGGDVSNIKFTIIDGGGVCRLFKDDIRPLKIITHIHKDEQGVLFILKKGGNINKGLHEEDALQHEYLFEFTTKFGEHLTQTFAFKGAQLVEKKPKAPLQFNYGVFAPLDKRERKDDL